MLKQGLVVSAVITSIYVIASTVVAQSDEEAVITSNSVEVVDLSALKISNVFYETSINDVAKDLSFQTGVNIFVTPSVEGLVTATFDEVSLEFALSAILFGTTLNYYANANTVIIYDASVQNFESIGAKKVRVIDLSSATGQEMIDLVPEVYRDFIQSVSSEVIGDAIVVVAADPIFTEVVGVVLAIDDDLSARQLAYKPKMVFKPKNIPAEPLYNLLSEEITNYVSVSENVNALFIQGGTEKTRQIYDLLSEIDNRASLVSDQLIQTYVLEEYTVSSIDVENYIRSVPNFLEDYISIISDTNKLVYFGPVDLREAFLELALILDENDSREQFAVLTASKLDVEVFLLSLPVNLRKNTFVDSENGKIIVSGTEAAVSQVIDIAKSLVLDDPQISYVFSIKDIASDDLKNSLPDNLRNYVTSLNGTNNVIFFGPSSLLNEVTEIINMLQKSDTSYDPIAFKLESVDIDTAFELIPEALEKFVTVDKMSRSIVVNGPEFAVNWAQDLVSRLNAVKKPVTRKFQLSNNFFSDVENLFPDYLKPFVFYDEDSNILVGHGPVEEVSRIQDIVEAIKSDTSYDPIAFKLESVDIDTAFELIPEALEKFVTVDKMSRSIVVNGPEFAVNWAQDLVSRLNAVKKPVTRIFQLSNNVLGDVGNLFPDYLKPFVFYDEDSNILVGHGPVEEVSRIQDIVETIDQKTPKKMLSKVFQFDQFSIVDFNKMIPKRLSENVFFDDKTKKLLVIGDQITVDEVEGIFIALNNPVEYDVAVFNYVNFDVKGFEQLIPKEFENYVSFDDNTNSVLVNGPKDVVEFVRKAISATEPLQDQIILEAKIVAFDRDESINFGPEFNWPDIAAGQAFGYDNSGIIRPWEVQFGYTIDQSFTNALNVSLELMSQNSEATIFANPTIVTENGSDAEIRVTTAEYVTVQFRDNGSTDVSLEEITTGTILKIKPTVDKDGSITLDLEVSVSDVVARGANNLPVVISRNASNRVKIDNGGTAAVAGLVDARTTGRNAGIPGLRHLPLFGTFGSQTVGSDNTKQVAIFVTARTTNSTDVNVKQKNASTFVQLSSDDAFRKEIKDVFALE